MAPEDRTERLPYRGSQLSRSVYLSRTLFYPRGIDVTGWLIGVDTGVCAEYLGSILMLSSLFEVNIGWLIGADTGVCAEYLGSILMLS